MLQIEKWKAFKGKYPPSSDKEHRIIIVYKYENTVRYFYVTSQIEKAKKQNKYDIGSLVTGINNINWSDLTEESCIQCNKKHICETTEIEIKNAYENGEISVLGEIPESVRREIINAVCASKSFTDIEKRMYTI